jgi:hypothetical protein
MWMVVWAGGRPPVRCRFGYLRNLSYEICLKTGPGQVLYSDTSCRITHVNAAITVLASDILNLKLSFMNRQRRCCQQLRPWSLHHRQGDRRLGVGPHQEVRRSVHRTPRLSHIPLLWRRHGVRLHFPPHGEALCRLRKKIQAGVRHLPGSTGLYRGR